MSISPTWLDMVLEGTDWRRCIEWVPEYLQDDTQDSLREQMRTDPSAADEYGFIYAFEIDGEITIPNFSLDDGGLKRPNRPDRSRCVPHQGRTRSQTDQATG